MSILLASLALLIEGTPSPLVADVYAEPRVLLSRKVANAPGQDDVAANLVLAGGGAWIVGWTSKGGAPSDGLLLHVDAEGEVLARRQVGGPGDDLLWSIQHDERGGYVCVGIRGAGGHRDGWMLALDGDGRVAWERTFGGAGDEWLTSVRATSDGWIAVGQTTSTGAGDLDAYVVRTDREGRELSSWTWGTPGLDRAFAIHPTKDGGCIIAGMSGKEHDTCDAFATRLDENGEPLWTRSVARPGFDVSHDLQPCTNGDLLVYGYSFMDEARDCDGFVRRLTLAGDVVFDATFGGAALDRVIHAQVFADGSSVVVGHSRAARSATEAWDLAVYALDPRGRASWTGRFGSPLVEFGRGIAGTREDLWIVGHSATEDESQSNVWLVRLDVSASARG